MAIDPKALLDWRFEDLEHAYTARDTILYALGIGLGNPPDDPDQLPFVYEAGLKALPTMAVVLAYPGFWVKDPRTGIDWRRVLHGEQGLVLHKPLPAAGTVIGRTRITGLVDKGKERGAYLFSEREVIDKASGELICRLAQTTVLRGDGGFGGPNGPTPQPHPISPAISPRCRRLPSSIGSRATTIRSTPIPRSPPRPASPGPYCTASAPSAPSGTPCSRRNAPMRPSA